VKPSLKEKQLKRKRVYTCDFLDVYEDDVVLPNNKRSQRVVVSHIGAAAAVPITKDGDVMAEESLTRNLLNQRTGLQFQGQCSKVTVTIICRF
jgi:hypothetical protein